MNIYDIFETDTKKEESGAPVKFGAATLYIASSSSQTNKKFAKRAAEFAERNSRLRYVDDKEKVNQAKEIYAECVLVGWENVTGKDGKELPYSKENALKLFNDLPRLYEEVVTIASDIKTFKEEKREEIAKN
ncbi:MAG: hypothetical protein NC124_02330 [Clostridium sp.]|nr:hypothetical protein [Clostridium sp.]